jgi:hypothetical protein
MEEFALTLSVLLSPLPEWSAKTPKALETQWFLCGTDRPQRSNNARVAGTTPRLGGAAPQA